MNLTDIAIGAVYSVGAVAGRAKRCPMDRPLAGRLILVVDDEPLIALDLASSFGKAGAKVTKATSLRHALALVEKGGLSAAVLDHVLADGDSSELCERLKELNIPFVMHSGLPKLEGACNDGVVMVKPTQPEVLVTTVVGLLSSRPISH
jgi:DNA-binding response OmpR family regulator